ncbi:hypothetical protein AMATHDRAFT_150803 [Amanita thiersii Skay4041]|uniref:Uncharacterized protein n=1 Tax=Amanita thiersii Skay4041 TaxID=703135 RepID=A0A2A9NJZ9_9AGAR|nr:hypothetical protein AMATHDRAFT_150803 [Amanita thiersii Skay4041]
MNNGNDPFPSNLDIQSFPAQYKDEGEEWCALYNPNIQRRLDIRLEYQYWLHRYAEMARHGITDLAVCSAIAVCRIHCSRSFFADPTIDESMNVWTRSLCFHPKEILLATGGDDNMIRIWDIIHETILIKLDAHKGEVYSLVFSPGGHWLASCGGDQKVKIWNWKARDAPCKVLMVHEAESTDEQYFSFTPDSRHLAVGCMDNAVRIWDVATTTLMAKLSVHTSSVYSVSFTPNGMGLVSSSFDGSSILWDTSAAGYAPGLGEQGGPGVSGLNGQAGELNEGSLKYCRHLVNFFGHRNYVLCNKVTENGMWLISGSRDWCIRIWDGRTGVVQCELTCHRNLSRCCAELKRRTRAK